MGNPAAKITEFVKWTDQYLTGDEKGEAQLFCERLFQAFGHAGIREAGGTLEYRIHKGKRTKYADLLWRPRLLLEMKTRGEKLAKHYQQAFEYWLQLVPHRPKFVILCNFDEFWIYDLDQQLDDPMDTVKLAELPERYTALNFLFPEDREPRFQNNRVAVTRNAAGQVAKVFHSLMQRDVSRTTAQRFVLQCVVALFAEDIDLLPRDLFTELIADCRQGASAYDLIGALFRQMNTPKLAKGGRFKDVPYFNGGIFSIIEPMDLTGPELELLAEAAGENWSRVKPAIFGTLFEGSMQDTERHAFGAHFTSEADIQKVVLPTIVPPWRERISAARTATELIDLRDQLLQYRVLDPACGSGNFLYIAYRELKRIELDLLERIEAEFGKRKMHAPGSTLVSAGQFFGIDIKDFAVELAKITLMLGKKLALDETQERLRTQQELPFDVQEQALPLDNLDNNIRCADALVCDWPHADAIIGNPPYQSKNKMQQIYGPKYLQQLRARYADVPGRADYCVYWFRRAHEELAPNGRAGLVGTNTIRQNYSREGGLDYIVNNGGTITEAVSSQVWSGEAQVHVSIVNWIKGNQPGLKKLFIQKGDHYDSPWEVFDLETINSSLSPSIDLTTAHRLRVNINSGGCYQGQTHGHEGFLLSPEEAAEMLAQSASYRQVIFPFLTAEEMIDSPGSQPGRWVIDFHPRDILTARSFAAPFGQIEKLVLLTRKEAAASEKARNADLLAGNPKAKVNHHHANFLKKWWLLSYPRQDLISKLVELPKYVSCGRVTKRPIFEFISSSIRPNDALMVFLMSDDYSFGILQSGLHWAWFTAKCSTLTERFRYTSDTVFDTFPWPQSPTLPQVEKVAAAAVALRSLRRQVMTEHNWSLRDLYRSLDLPGNNPLRTAQDKLDAAVREA